MDEIKIGAEIVFNITGNHNIGYAKGEKYIGTVLSKDHRSRLYVRTIGMPRACIDERDVEWANRGESLAYTEDQFMKLIQDNGITYNDVIQRGWI